MKEWLADNWPYLLAAILYVLERSQALTADRAEKIRKLVEVLSGVSVGAIPANLGGLKGAMKARELYHDAEIDSALDVIRPESTARVSKGKRFLRGLVNVLPIVSRLVK